MGQDFTTLERHQGSYHFILCHTYHEVNSLYSWPALCLAVRWVAATEAQPYSTSFADDPAFSRVDALLHLHRRRANAAVSSKLMAGVSSCGAVRCHLRARALVTCLI